jgi:Kef-type K+ transport system membrane component KefB
MKYFFLILLIVLSIKIIKFIGTYISCRILNINPKDSLRIGINLSQISEFSLIIISVLFQNRLLWEKEYQIFTIIIVLSMIFSIFIMKYTMKKNIIFPKKKDLI